MIIKRYFYRKNTKKWGKCSYKNSCTYHNLEGGDVLEKFLDLLVENEEVRSKFFSQKNIKDAYMAVKDSLEGISFEDFSDQIAFLCSMSSKELEEEALANVSGGANVLFVKRFYKDFNKLLSK